MHPGASHLTRRSMAQTVTRVCSSLTQTVQSLQSLLAVAGWVVAEIQLQCAVMLHPLADISAASFSALSSHPTLMMRAMSSFFAMSTAAIHGAHCFSIGLLPGKLSR